MLKAFHDRLGLLQQYQKGTSEWDSSTGFFRPNLVYIALYFSGNNKEISLLYQRVEIPNMCWRVREELPSEKAVSIS